MILVNTQDFQKTIDSDSISLVVFSSKDCPPCTLLKKSLSEVEGKYPKIHQYEFHRAQLDSKELIIKQRVDNIPRMVFYSKGEDLGRLLIIPHYHKEDEKENERVVKDIASLLCVHFDELMDIGRVLSRGDDGEEVARFYEVVRKAIKLDWKDIPGDKREDEGKNLMYISHSIVQAAKNWSILNAEGILKAMKMDTYKTFFDAEKKEGFQVVS